MPGWGKQIPKRNIFRALVAGLSTLAILGAAYAAWHGIRQRARGAELFPADGEQEASSTTSIRITFAALPDQSDAAARFSVTPPLEGSLAWEGSALVFRPARPLSYGQVYTVTLRDDVSWSFRVGHPRITYLAVDEQERLQLWVTSAQGGPPAQLTAGDRDVWDYALHPEGTLIAYSLTREDEGTDLWQVGRDGSDPRLLLRCPRAACTAPAWSPDGRQIAYERKDLSETQIGFLSGPLTPHIWLLDLDSGETGPLFADAPTPGHSPLWAPAGRRLAFYDMAEGAVQIYDLDSGQQQFFDTISGVGTWDPSGEEMILPDSTFHNQASDDYLIRISFTTRQVQKLNTSFAVDDTLPHWSPTGEWVALGRTGLPDGTPTWGTQLWLMRPDGSRAQPLVTDKEANFGAFAWRSDGGALAYVRLSMEDLADPRPELWIVDLSDRQPRLLARDAIMPDWLP